MYEILEHLPYIYSLVNAFTLCQQILQYQNLYQTIVNLDQNVLMYTYMPNLTLWDKISQNFDPSGPHFP